MRALKEVAALQKGLPHKFYGVILEPEGCRHTNCRQIKKYDRDH